MLARTSRLPRARERALHDPITTPVLRPKRKRRNRETAVGSLPAPTLTTVTVRMPAVPPLPALSCRPGKPATDKSIDALQHRETMTPSTIRKTSTAKRMTGLVEERPSARIQRVECQSPPKMDLPLESAIGKENINEHDVSVNMITVMKCLELEKFKEELRARKIAALNEALEIKSSGRSEDATHCTVIEQAPDTPNSPEDCDEKDSVSIVAAPLERVAIQIQTWWRSHRCCLKARMSKTAPITESPTQHSVPPLERADEQRIFEDTHLAFEGPVDTSTSTDAEIPDLGTDDPNVTQFQMLEPLLKRDREMRDAQANQSATIATAAEPTPSVAKHQSTSETVDGEQLTQRNRKMMRQILLALRHKMLARRRLRARCRAWRTLYGGLYEAWRHLGGAAQFKAQMRMTHEDRGTWAMATEWRKRCVEFFWTASG